MNLKVLLAMLILYPVADHIAQQLVVSLYDLLQSIQIDEWIRQLEQI